MRQFKFTVLLLLLLTAAVNAKVYLGIVEVYFNSEKIDSVMISKIDRAESSIRLAIYSVTDSTIAEALIRAHERGVDIKVACEKQQTELEYVQDERLIENGLDVVRDTEDGLMHRRYMIVDKEIVLIGLFNYTKNVTEENRGNLIVIYDCNIVKEFQVDFFGMYNGMKVQE